MPNKMTLPMEMATRGPSVQLEQEGVVYRAKLVLVSNQVHFWRGKEGLGMARWNGNTTETCPLLLDKEIHKNLMEKLSKEIEGP